MHNPQSVIDKLIPKWKQLYFKYKSIRTVPFRKQFFIGYDLSGNTYWEFKLESTAQNLRRKLIPTKRKDHIFDYYQTVPPQWHQWLRFTRETPPSVMELLKDEERLRVLKINSKIIDANWKNQKLYDELVNKLQLDNELIQLENKRQDNFKTEREYLQNLKSKVDKDVVLDKKPEK